VAATADGGCWVTLWAANSVVRYDGDGRLAGEATFQPGAEPRGIALAPDETV
jgi:virginiamycin B lyase